METLCSRFYAIISGMNGDIDMGSSGECVELRYRNKTWSTEFFYLTVVIEISAQNLLHRVSILTVDK